MNPLKFQYSFCSYSTNFLSPYLPLKSTFQYSFCSYSTYCNALQVSAHASFQYSFCSYSTHALVDILGGKIEFQYSFCSYSTCPAMFVEKVTAHFNTASVPIQQNLLSIAFCEIFISIQLLFLFNPFSSINTLSTQSFQYSFCSYSTAF